MEPTRVSGVPATGMEPPLAVSVRVSSPVNPSEATAMTPGLKKLR